MNAWESYIESDQAHADCADWLREHADELADNPHIRAEWEAGDGYTTWIDSRKDSRPPVLCSADDEDD